MTSGTRKRSAGNAVSSALMKSHVRFAGEKQWMYATIEVNPAFSEVSLFGSLRHLPKTD